MTDPQDRLLDELKRLRRGRGIQAPAIGDQVGPLLRELCGIQDEDGHEVIREKLTRALTELIGDFPEDLKRAVRTALGMMPGVQHQFLNDRVAWLAGLEERDSRTISRKIDAGLLRLSEAALKPQSVPPPLPGEEWHVRRFDALLRLDGPTPVSHEVRTIVAGRDGIDQISWSISVPKASENATGGLDVEVLRGVVLLARRQVSARRLVLDLKLPAPLNAGQTHEFALEVRIPRGQAMRPTYVYWPERRCERFNLVVRFPTSAVPQAVWQVSGAFHRDVDDIEPGPDPLAVDNIGEARAAFDELQTDRGYGIQWRF
jgi:hypothetical protein